MRLMRRLAMRVESSNSVRRDPAAGRPPREGDPRHRARRRGVGERVPEGLRVPGGRRLPRAKSSASRWRPSPRSSRGLLRVRVLLRRRRRALDRSRTRSACRTFVELVSSRRPEAGLVPHGAPSPRLPRRRVGPTPRHQLLCSTSASASTPGATTSMLTLDEQLALDAVIVSHAHLDHVRDLVVAGRQPRPGRPRAPLVVAGTAFTIRALREHFFNNVLWPDFTAINAGQRHRAHGRAPGARARGPPPTSRGLHRPPRCWSRTPSRARASSISRDGAEVAISGDTGPTSAVLGGARRRARTSRPSCRR
jgi:hypothetical protein